MQISVELTFVIQYHSNKFHNLPLSDFYEGMVLMKYFLNDLTFFSTLFWLLFLYLISMKFNFKMICIPIPAATNVRRAVRKCDFIPLKFIKMTFLRAWLMKLYCLVSVLQTETMVVTWSYPWLIW